MTKIFVDLDGVIVNFQDAACEIHKRPTPYLDSKNHGNYDMCQLFGMSHEEFVRPMDYKFWYGLEKMDDAKCIMGIAKELGKVFFLSAPVATRGCKDGKFAWVRKHYSQYRLILADSEAKHALAHPNAYLIDDRDENIKEFTAHKGRGILVPRPWNSLHKYEFDPSLLVKCIRMQIKMHAEGKI